MDKPPRGANETLITTWLFFRYMAIGLYIVVAAVGSSSYGFLYDVTAPPLRQSKVKTQKDLAVRDLPKHLSLMEELGSLIRMYSQVLQRYYVQYLAGYDSAALAQMIQTTSVTSEKDNVPLSSIRTKISELLVNNMEDPDQVSIPRSLIAGYERQGAVWIASDYVKNIFSISLVPIEFLKQMQLLSYTPAKVPDSRVQEAGG
jgi:hypothetical protein